MSKQNIRNLEVSGRAVLDQAIAGEFPVALMIFNHHAVISAQQGAPSDRIPSSPCPRSRTRPRWRSTRRTHTPRSCSSTTSTPRTGSASCSRPIILPAHPNVPAKDPKLKPEQGGYRANFMSPEDMVRHDREWTDLFRKLFNQPG